MIFRKKKTTVLPITGTGYALVNRGTKCEPWVAAYGYDPADGSWKNGEYFKDPRQALYYILANGDPEGMIWCAIDVCERHFGRNDIGDMLTGMILNEYA